MFPAQRAEVMIDAQVSGTGVQILALAALLAGCSVGGPQLALTVSAAASGRTAATGLIVTGTPAGDQLRVELVVRRWNDDPSFCVNLNPFSGGGCGGSPSRPVRDAVVTLTASTGVLSATTVTTDVNGTATVELTAPKGPLTLTAESGLLKTTERITLEAPLSRIRFGPVGDYFTGQVFPPYRVYVELVDLDGEIPTFSRFEPRVHFALVGCNATVVISGNNEGLPLPDEGASRWSRVVYPTFQAPGVGCRWSATAEGFARVTSDTFTVRQ